MWERSAKYYPFTRWQQNKPECPLMHQFKIKKETVTMSTGQALAMPSDPKNTGLNLLKLVHSSKAEVLYRGFLGASGGFPAYFVTLMQSKLSTDLGFVRSDPEELEYCQ